jgi:hypothetical protein
LAWANYQHWDGYRQLVASIRQQISDKRVWTTTDLGLRFYLEQEGGLPLSRTDIVQPGQWLVTSAMSHAFDVSAPMAVVQERTITPTLPFRLIGLGSRSGYSSAQLGFRAFDITTAPIDHVKVEAVLERRPTLSYLPMNAPEAKEQIVTGIYDLEGRWRWTSGKAVLLLKPPSSPKPIRVKLHVHDLSPARKLTISVDGVPALEQAIPGPGTFTYETKPISGSAVTLEFDKTFSPQGDARQLGVILMEVGYVLRSPNGRVARLEDRDRRNASSRRQVGDP